MRASVVLVLAVLLSGCILRAEQARTNPFGRAESTDNATNEDIERDRAMRERFLRHPDGNRGCGGCS